MALRDLPNYDPNAFIDPATGLPYTYGSPGYQEAELPFLEKAVQRQSREAANARGMLSSGASTEAERQAMNDLLYKMSDAGAQQAYQEKLLQEEQAFQEKMARESEAANAALAEKQGAAGLKAAAIGGGSQAAGTLGSLWLMNKMMHPTVPAPTATPVPSLPGPLGSEPSPAGYGASVGEAAPEAAATPAAAPAPSGLGSLAYHAGSLAAGGAGAFGANKLLHSVVPGMGTEGDIGSGVGGAVGQFVGGPAGATVGSAYGGLVGNQMKTPLRGLAADFLLGPLGPIASAIPGFDNGLRDAGNWIGARLGL